MNPHPCNGHACDHCYLCDVVGVCCRTVTPDQRALLEAEHRATPSDRLHNTIIRDAESVVTLPELVYRDAATGTGVLHAARRLGLMAAADPFSHESQKEVVHALNANRALR
jgi:hypothetical protein